MSIKVFVVVATLCALLLTQTASCEDVDAQLTDEVYILKPETVSPIIITDPDSPLLDVEDRRRICNRQRCQQSCRKRGYRYGRCNKGGRGCFCSDY